mmetsp:Transcript_29579/g.41608  ORF Transcript_29579/g.41608 Transcript_29579/m.41608 type:complete len:205 (-) Transcript_29579:673-1287(-)
MVSKQSCNLFVNILDSVLFFMVRVKYFKESFVDVWLLKKSHLNFFDVVSSMVKLRFACSRIWRDGTLLLLCWWNWWWICVRIVVCLSWCCDFWRFIIWNMLDLVSRRKESVEPKNQIFVSFKKLAHSGNDTWSIDTLSFEVFHDIQKLIINSWLVGKLEFHLVQKVKSILKFNLSVWCWSLRRSNSSIHWHSVYWCWYLCWCCY